MASVETGPRTAVVPKEIRLEAPKLIILGGVRKGDEIPLGAPGERIVLGSAAAIVVPEARPRHAEIELCQDRSGLLVRDLSGGDTRVNGATVHEAIVAPGSTLQLGEVEIALTDGRTVVVLPSTRDRFGDARGRSLAMRELFGALEVLAPTDSTVLLLGETGTGKDVLARAIHRASPRRDGPLFTLDSSAIAPSLVESELFGHERGAFTGASELRAGAFEQAQGGTLFLDEIGELPLDVQAKLLGAVEDRAVKRLGGNDSISVDVRIVAATKRDLEEEVARGRFRQDLYYRLAVIPVVLPPLRERRDDIPLLVETFVDLFAIRTGRRASIDPQEVHALLGHDWPGNVRELRNTVERALWLAQTGDGDVRFMLPRPEHLFEAERATAPSFDAARPFSEHKEGWEREFEKKYLGWLLARAGGSISKAARLASMDRKHLRELLRKHSLRPAPED